MSHRFGMWRFGYQLCYTCGLVWLRNAVSQAAARAKCPG